MNDFEKFMNTPGHSIYPPTDNNIIEEYKRRNRETSCGRKTSNGLF